MTPSIANVLALEEGLKELPQIDLPLAHFFIKGVYARSMFIPAGTALTGKIHNHDCISIVASGDISLMTSDGMQRVQAPYTAISKAGLKRAGYAHQDTVFITVHRTDETDIDIIEDVLVSETYEDFKRLAA